MIDLRSDTVTRPTPAMLQTMMQAEVGDDVFSEDETMNAFQAKVAAMFGMEAGLFVPSGTMSNQLGVKVLTHPGDEVLIDETGHIFNYETSASAVLSGVQLNTIIGKKGKLSVGLLRDNIRGNYDWEPKTRVICLENSTNKGGGACYSKDELLAIKVFADEQNLKVHLDGARIWNAITATGIEPEFFGTIAETISVCFSKGLGAPIGSMLLSSKENIAKARRFRKMWGGGMRQIGILAAAAGYALETHWPLLQEDHRRAKELAKVIAQCGKLSINPDDVETNIVIFDVVKGEVSEALSVMEKEGIRMTQFGPKSIRATFHFQVGDEDLEKVKATMKDLFN